MWWRERFRNGIRGIGGDLQHVKDGVGELKIVEVKSERKIDRVATLTKDAGMRKIIINVPPSLPSAGPEGSEAALEDEVSTRTAPTPKVDVTDARPVDGMKLYNGTSIGGKCVEYAKGYSGVALLKVREGLWEERRGHKVDGGERRKAEVRAKRRVQERKNAR